MKMKLSNRCGSSCWKSLHKINMILVSISIISFIPYGFGYPDPSAHYSSYPYTLGSLQQQTSQVFGNEVSSPVLGSPTSTYFLRRAKGTYKGPISRLHQYQSPSPSPTFTPLTEQNSYLEQIPQEEGQILRNVNGVPAEDNPVADNPTQQVQVQPYEHEAPGSESSSGNQPSGNVQPVQPQLNDVYRNPLLQQFQHPNFGTNQQYFSGASANPFLNYRPPNRFSVPTTSHQTAQPQEQFLRLIKITPTPTTPNQPNPYKTSGESLPQQQQLRPFAGPSYENTLVNPSLNLQKYSSSVYAQNPSANFPLNFQNSLSNLQNSIRYVQSSTQTSEYSSLSPTPTPVPYPVQSYQNIYPTTATTVHNTGVSFAKINSAKVPIERVLRPRVHIKTHEPTPRPVEIPKEFNYKSNSYDESALLNEFDDRNILPLSAFSTIKGSRSSDVVQEANPVPRTDTVIGRKVAVDLPFVFPTQKPSNSKPDPSSRNIETVPIQRPQQPSFQTFQFPTGFSSSTEQFHRPVEEQPLTFPQGPVAVAQSPGQQQGQSQRPAVLPPYQNYRDQFKQFQSQFQQSAQTPNLFPNQQSRPQSLQLQPSGVNLQPERPDLEPEIPQVISPQAPLSLQSPERPDPINGKFRPQRPPGQKPRQPAIQRFPPQPQGEPEPLIIPRNPDYPQPADPREPENGFNPNHLQPFPEPPFESEFEGLPPLSRKDAEELEAYINSIRSGNMNPQRVTPS